MTDRNKVQLKVRSMKYIRDKEGEMGIDLVPTAKTIKPSVIRTMSQLELTVEVDKRDGVSVIW